MQTYLNILKTSAGLLSATATYLLSTNIPSIAAENVVLRYGILSESISVTELQQIAETGKIQGHYKKYTNRLPVEKRQALLTKLQTKYPVNFVTLSRFLYTPGASAILKDLAKVTLHSESGGMQALRSALVHGAKNKKGLSIISFIDAYPSEQLEIDVEKASKAFNQLDLAYKQTQQFMDAIAPQLSAINNSQFSSDFDPTQPGNAGVDVLKLNLKDEKRSSRSVPVDIYFPQASTKKTTAKPVVVLSHGFSSNKSDMVYIAKHLASHGYVVAAVEHTGSDQNYQINWTKKDGIVSLMKPQEFLERPRDISFILDKLTEFNNQSNHPLFGQVSTDNVTAIGHSFGGGTVLAIAGGEMQIDYLKAYCRDLPASTNSSEWLQCIAQDLPEKKYQLRDRRVKQVIALNPTTSVMFGETGLEKIQIPTFMLASSADKTTPALTEQVISFNKIPSPKWLVGIVGATHGSVKDPASIAGRESQNKSEVVGEKAADIRKYIQGITLAFVSKNSSFSSDVFLTPEYAVDASTKTFPIRLVREIPADVMKLVYQAVGKNK
ncbi:alpha/beta hydrolase [Calothrix sp. CCY 0018]|uniref:alpha/beta hydrolase n=1 Tax=Calothrix sp. CCY 0018 TaxID=3103864 RepID=UPI0039C5EB19